ncbi:3'-5' exonuclease [Catenulispora pinisilvae]|uniref:3'-5' exonuclease n=1 Tax=Catenulispora pinisilvae TaxID=2705253 RepID=UPI001891C843|nr:3'-5' exonuclease [Catenulispora pinisilvae]
MNGYAVVDVETSGFHPPVAEIVEVGIVHVDVTGQVTGSWDSLLRPEGGVGATRVHGITREMVERAPRFADIGFELHALLADRVVVAHNLAFDSKFLVTQFAQIGVHSPEIAGGACTLRTSQALLPGPSYKLLDCCEAVGVVLTDAHSALGDALATARLLGHFLTHGIAVGGMPVPPQAPVPQPRAEVGERFLSRSH